MWIIGVQHPSLCSSHRSTIGNNALVAPTRRGGKEIDVSPLARQAKSALLAVITLSACFHSPGALRPSRHINYWEAIADLHPDDAVEAARSPSEKAFAQSLRSLMAGDIDSAEKGFGQLRRTATDSIIRIGARVIYTATLQYQEKWGLLATLRSESAEPKTDRSDRASIERWAAAFKNVPAKTLAFRAQSALLPMSVSAVGTPLIPVRIGGKSYNFWLDTGSSMTMLASDVAQDLNILPLVPDTLEIVTSTGRVSANPSLIPEMQIGQVEVRNAPTMIVTESMMRISEPRPVDQSTRMKLDGIIGFDIIRQLDIEVDYGEGTMRLRNPANSRHLPDRNMFWVGLPVVQIASSDGIPLHFGLDTGAQLTFVTETLLDRLQLQAARTESRRVGGLGGEISLRAPVLPDLRVLVRGFPILFKGAVVRAPVYQVLASLDGVLGGDIWNSGLVRIDMTNGIFAVSRPKPEF